MEKKTKKKYQGKIGKKGWREIDAEEEKEFQERKKVIGERK